MDILTTPRNAIVKQYTKLFEEENITLHFTKEALVAIANKAKKAGTGARALRMIVENLLRDLMYEGPSDPTIREVLIEENTVTANSPPVIIRDDNKKAG